MVFPKKSGQPITGLELRTLSRSANMLATACSMYKNHPIVSLFSAYSMVMVMIVAVRRAHKTGILSLFIPG